MSAAALSIVTTLPAIQAPITPDEAKTLVITDQQSLELAALYIKELKGVIREIEAKRTDMKAPVLEAGRRIDANAAEAKAPLLRALAILEPRYTAYLDEQERIRREEQRRLEEEARKRAEEEQLAAAIAAEAAGATAEEVEAIVNETPPAPIPIAAPRVQRVAGISTPETWSAEVTDSAAFMRWAVASGQFALLEIRMPALNAMARAQRNTMQIPGVRAVSSRGVRVGGR
jgi:hypothetical protein